MEADKEQFKRVFTTQAIVRPFFPQDMTSIFKKVLDLTYPFTSMFSGELQLLRPVYTGNFCCDFSGDFCCDFVAISRRFPIARVNYWRFRGDLNLQ